MIVIARWVWSDPVSFKQEMAGEKHCRVVRNEMSVMIKKTIWVLLAVAVLAFVLGTTVRADERDTPKAVAPAIAVDVTALSLTDLETVSMETVPLRITDAGPRGSGWLAYGLCTAELLWPR